jgi:hypothetical protein
MLAILFMTFGFIAPKYFKILWFSNLLTLPVYSKLDSYAFIPTFIVNNFSNVGICNHAVFPFPTIQLCI